jgi:uncharacterized protein with HEPN domain
MAVRRIEPILAEIMEALDGISAAAAGKTLDDFNSDWLLRQCIERGIEIISEAARTFQMIWQHLLPRFHGNKFVG